MSFVRPTDFAHGVCIFRDGGALRPLQAITSFIDEHRGVFGVEPICRLLPIAPSTYYENGAKRLDGDRLSGRACSDISLKIEIRRVFEQNYRVCGVRKVWRPLKREDFDVARCTLARLMRSMSLQGIIRGKPTRTPFPDKTARSPLDRVNRQFKIPCAKQDVNRRGMLTPYQRPIFTPL